MRARRASDAVFTDTSAFYAIFDAHDGRHREAEQLLQRLAAERYALATTSFVVAETHALLLSRMRRVLGAVEARQRSRAAIEQVYDALATIIRPVEEDERQALMRSAGSTTKTSRSRTR